MKNSVEKRQLTLRLVNHYCDLLEIKDVPDLIFYKKDILQLPREERGNITYKRLCGCYYIDSNVIYVNLSNHKTRKQLIDTVIHELVHKVSECTLPHGVMFDNMVKLISSLD